MEVHKQIHSGVLACATFAPGRDVMERMIKAGCAATSDFEWLSQLRFVFSREDGPFGMCSVRQTNCQLEYSYEYQV